MTHLRASMKMYINQSHWTCWCPRLLDIYFFSLNLLNLLDDHKSTLDAHISTKDVALLQPNGFSSKFYKEHIHWHCAEYCIYNDSFENYVFVFEGDKYSISLILKKGQQPKDCASYIPIYLLHMDLKGLLSLLFNEDQTSHNSWNNMCRLLNTFPSAVNRWSGCFH